MSGKIEFAPVPLRIAIGIIFLFHGAAKVLLMPDAMVAFFQQIGFPGFFAYLVGLAEMIAGAAVLVGFGTRIAAAVLSLILLVATFKVKLAMGFVTDQGLPGWEFDFALLGATLALVLSGSGKYSVDEWLARGERRSPAA